MTTPSILEALHVSPLLPEHERAPSRVLAEASALLGAGVDAPANTMTEVVYRALRNPSILQKLRAELKGLQPPPINSSRKDSLYESDSPFKSDRTTTLVPSRTLYDLPYLQACIKESLRHNPAVLSRMPRINPAAPMTYTTPSSSREQQKTYVLPPGTVISMSLADSLFCPSAFAPDPHAFRPERWLDGAADADATISPEQRKRMEKAFVPFSKGAKMCIGHELAKREIALVLGNFFRTFDVELDEGVCERDVGVAYARDFFGPLVENGRGAVWVRLKRVMD
ncbi:Cytochrome P450 monooxygenase azaI [Lasiodiplodia hormozganensis]|uniref:Cytochrome P450 monooxygenase azaI n=1 Tax=Lasiodiplodia hormozganensis TaxID=869390 RepID=A0AA40CJ74_9PEZI|nr:Cytochrome P450 monooxygenase azaI [Lasiodiplodia hormozganensis]